MSIRQNDNLGEYSYNPDFNKIDSIPKRSSSTQDNDKDDKKNWLI